jgi:hypothetical protein
MAIDIKYFRASPGKFVLLTIYVIVVFLAPFYTAFSYDPEKMVSTIAKFIPAKDDQFFRNYVSLLKGQKIDEVYALLSPDTQQSVTKEGLVNVVEQFATVSASEIVIVGSAINHVLDSPSYTNYLMTYEVPNNDSTKKYMLVEIAARDAGQGIRVEELKTYFGSKSIVEGGKFAFPKPDWTLIVALLAPLFVVYTAYRYLTKSANPRWWWFIGILFLSVYMTVRPGPEYGVSLGLNGFMGLATVWGPWVYSPFLPLGAIVYYFFRKHLEVQ